MTAEYAVATVEDVPEGKRVVVEVRGREMGILNLRRHCDALPHACFQQNGPPCHGAVSNTLVANAETGWKRAVRSASRTRPPAARAAERRRTAGHRQKESNRAPLLRHRVR